jgi:hypothetical protein
MIDPTLSRIGEVYPYEVLHISEPRITFCLIPLLSLSPEPP